MDKDKLNSVVDFWNTSACGERLYLKGNSEVEAFVNQSKIRYYLEPEILEFIDNEDFKAKHVLEIGVGLGSDHHQLAQRGAILTGCDLTSRSVAQTKKRFDLFDLESDLMVANAEKLPFSDHSFDIVYSWGVLHHSPNPSAAIKEVYRVLKPGGKALIMIYQKRSIVGAMLWLRYGLFRGKPRRSLDYIYDRYLESPGTKAYSVAGAKNLFSNFLAVDISSNLSHADLLNSKAGQRHEGLILRFTRKVFPRRVIKLFFKSWGLFLKIKAIK